jgi:hypothetical protein
LKSFREASVITRFYFSRLDRLTAATASLASASASAITAVGGVASASDAAANSDVPDFFIAVAAACGNPSATSGHRAGLNRRVTAIMRGVGFERKKIV